MTEYRTIEDIAAVNRSRSFSTIDALFNYLGKKVTPSATLQEILSAPIKESERTPTPEQLDKIVDLALSAETGAMTKALHGAAPGRELFANFDKKFIGTGEGGKARGWGFYFTDVRDIAADVYAKHGLEYTNYYTYKGKEYTNLRELTSDKHTQRLIAESIFKGRQIDPTNPKAGALKHLEGISSISDTREARNILENITSIEKGKPGYVYNVTLHPHKEVENWLEWDSVVTKEQLSLISHKDISKKNIAEEILIGQYGWEPHDIEWKLIKEHKTYKQMLDEAEEVTGEKIQITGGNLYHVLENRLGSSKAASEFLDRAGIDGIRFEAGSIMGIKPHVIEKKIESLPDEQAQIIANKVIERFELKKKPDYIYTKEGKGKQFLKEYKNVFGGTIQDIAEREGFLPKDYNYVIFNPEHIQINQIEDVAGNVVRKF